MKNTLHKIIMAAMFASLACVATMIIKIPSPLNGYINLGDCVILVVAFTLPCGYGFFAASVGSCLADILSGYTGRKMPVLCETTKAGLVHGYTPNFIEIRFENKEAKPNDIIQVELSQIHENAEFVLGL
jgi:uncharacterized membrane protein